jgi:hypothetical protein
MFSFETAPYAQLFSCAPAAMHEAFDSSATVRASYRSWHRSATLTPRSRCGGWELMATAGLCRRWDSS